MYLERGSGHIFLVLCSHIWQWLRGLANPKRKTLQKATLKSQDKLISWTVFSFKTFWTLARIVVYFICALATVFARWDATFINIWSKKRKAFTHNVAQWNSNLSYHSTPVDHASILILEVFENYVCFVKSKFKSVNFTCLLSFSRKE